MSGIAISVTSVGRGRAGQGLAWLTQPRMDQDETQSRAWLGLIALRLSLLLPLVVHLGRLCFRRQPSGMYVLSGILLSLIFFLFVCFCYIGAGRGFCGINTASAPVGEHKAFSVLLSSCPLVLFCVWCTCLAVCAGVEWRRGGRV